VNSKGHPAIRAPTEVGILDEVGASDRATLRIIKDEVLGGEGRALCKVLDIVDEKPLLINCKGEAAGYHKPRKVRQSQNAPNVGSVSRPNATSNCSISNLLRQKEEVFKMTGNI
jgi:hypothetical protein